MVGNKYPKWEPLLGGAGDILIIHHWDTDGISSAAIFTDYIQNISGVDLNIDYVVPAIGTYRLLPGSVPEKNLDIPSKAYDIIAVVDYSVPKEDIIDLKERYRTPIIVYDHHLRKPVAEENIFYYNPVACGDSGKKWPSTTWVLKEYLKIPVNDLIVMGIAGDLEERFLPAGFKLFPEVKKYLNGSEKKYMEYVRAKNLIDIHYKENDDRFLKKIAARVLKLKGNPEKIAGMKSWHKKEELLKKEMENILKRKPSEVIGTVAEVHRIDTHKSIISAVARRLAAKTGYIYVMVINRRFFKDKTQIYVRLKDGIRGKDTSVFKETAFALGGQVGGKDEVAGIIINDLAVDEFIREVRNYYE